MEHPNILLSLPGQWPDRLAIGTSIVQTSIAQQGGGLIFAGGNLLDTATNQSYRLAVHERDPGLASEFAAAGRGSLGEADLAAIEAHTHILAVSGPGGSAEHAKRLLEVGARLLDAGAVAVMVDSSGVAHRAERWRAMAAASEPSALYDAYVVLFGAQGRFYSCGMHNLGLPDASAPGTLAPGDAARLLQGFLLYLLHERPSLQNGHTFSLDTRSPRYTLRMAPCRWCAPDQPFYNPYGIWELG